MAEPESSDSQLRSYVTNEKLAALEAAAGLEPTSKNIQRLVEKFGDDGHWAFTQWQLRKKARGKFSIADQMLFTKEALEQATHEAVATYHASLFPTGVPVVDLTAGIGADLIQFAARGPVIGFELDAERLAYAEWNVKVYQREATLHCQDSLKSWSDPAYAFADPARRISGKRVSEMTDFQPNPMNLSQLFRGTEIAAIKLGPMLNDRCLRQVGPRQEFVSYGRECREALVIFDRKLPNGTYAKHLESGEVLESQRPMRSTSEPHDWIHEADPAAIRADALGSLCERFGLKALGDSNGYLTGGVTKSPWLTSFAVLWHGKADMGLIKAELKGLGSGTPELKQRDCKFDLVRLRREFLMRGELATEVAFWPQGKSLRAAILLRKKSEDLP